MLTSNLSDLISRLNLRRAGHEWRGDCPLCSYRAAFVLSVGNGGYPIGWCASCQDRAGIAALLGGTHVAYDITSTERERADRERRAHEAALRLWRGSEPARGTLADRYLTARALPGLAASPALRFRGDCPHPAGGRCPAMIALVTDVTGAPVAVHRTHLRRDGTGKAGVTPAKASLGPVWGGSIRLDPLATDLVIGEGIESSASAGHILGLPAWAAISAGNLARGMVLPPKVRSVVIAADPDEPGRNAARKAWMRWTGEGRRVRIATPGQDGCDFNDLLRAREAVHG